MLMPRLNEEEPGNFTDHFGDVILDKSKVNVYLDSNEPDFYAPYPMGMLLEKAPHFDVILTRRPELLKFPNAKLFCLEHTGSMDMKQLLMIRRMLFLMR